MASLVTCTHRLYPLLCASRERAGGMSSCDYKEEADDFMLEIYKMGKENSCVKIFTISVTRITVNRNKKC
jgi:hypothetical protein